MASGKPSKHCCFVTTTLFSGLKLCLWELKMTQWFHSLFTLCTKFLPQLLCFVKMTKEYFFLAILFSCNVLIMTFNWLTFIIFYFKIYTSEWLHFFKEINVLIFDIHIFNEYRSIYCIIVSNQTLAPYSANFAPKGANKIWLALLVPILFPFIMYHWEEQQSRLRKFPKGPIQVCEEN